MTKSMNELRGLARPSSNKWWDLSDGRGIMGGKKIVSSNLLYVVGEIEKEYGRNVSKPYSDY
jgi:hypothetical protein